MCFLFIWENMDVNFPFDSLGTLLEPPPSLLILSTTFPNTEYFIWFVFAFVYLVAFVLIACNRFYSFIDSARKVDLIS